MDHIRISSFKVSDFGNRFSSTSRSKIDEKDQLSKAKQCIASNNYIEAQNIIDRLVSIHYPPALVLLGDMYLSGQVGCAHDPVKAVELYQQAADRDSLYACFRLGQIYHYGANGINSSGELAYSWYIKGVNFGIPEDCKDEETIRAFAAIHNNLGNMFHDSFFNTNDRSTAIDHYQRAKWHYQIALDHGDKMAQGNLGQLYQLDHSKRSDQSETRSPHGNAFEKDHAEALACFRASVEGGNAFDLELIDSIFQYGHSIEKGHAEKLEWNKDKQAARFARECTATGDMYRLGNGVNINYPETRAWYQKAIGDNEPSALKKLAWLNSYEHRKLQEAVTFEKAQDYKAAYDIYLALEKCGSAKAQYQLGLLFQNGLGLVQNLEVAVFYYRVADKGGNLDACNCLGYLVQHGLGVKQGSKEAVTLYRKAAEGGNSRGCNNLAFMYQNGIGIKKDLHEAKKWFELAHKLKNPDALRSLGMVQKEIQAFECLKQKNYRGAFDLFISLARDGSPEAQLQLGAMYTRWRAADRIPKAMLFLEMVDRNKYKTPEMALRLGDAYMVIADETKDKGLIRKALANYQIASVAGIQEAGTKLRRLSTEAGG